MSACPFCPPDARRVFHQEAGLYACLWDAFPVSPGHALVVAHRHVSSWFAATLEERQSLLAGIDVARHHIEAVHRPEGYNLGVNIGEAAGQSVGHLHVHVIPRYEGDVSNPRGGVRGVLPAQADYRPLMGRGEPANAVGEQGPLWSGHSHPKNVPEVTTAQAEPPAPVRIPRVVGSERAPFLRALVEDLATCRALDVAVAFILPSGVDRVLPYIQDLLNRGGRVRLLTGDYMDTTDPLALRRLLDVEPAAGSPGRFLRRVFATDAELGFHPKIYLLHDEAAYVGSSNLTRHGLERGIELNIRIEPKSDPDGFSAANRAFEWLFCHPKTTELSEDWIRAYEARRRLNTGAAPREIPSEAPLPPPEPHEVQNEALAALRATRAQGNRAGLAVLATGLGKTWLSAFDSQPFARVLFVAHREEILQQARDTYRRIRPTSRLGSFSGTVKDREADVLFASVQTLSRRTHLESFPPAHFQYIVIDEFHHAVAATYRRILGHFQPAFILGLTATPERTDGGDLLALCQENLVYRCDVLDGIRRGLLCPFHYFGVPDDIDYAQIPWRNGRFDPDALEQAVATQRRAQNALEQWRKHAGPRSRTLAFCVSQRHADFMKEYFRHRDVRVAAVHAGPTSDPRTHSLESLAAGDLDVLFCVDMFNEGVDVPAVDAVLMLRPTESRILWLQQVGRGLRHVEGKTLTVIDYVGNHRSFLQGALVLLSPPDETRASLAAALKRLEEGALGLPPGCSITYDLRALENLRALLPPPDNREAVRLWYEDYRNRHGTRPTAVQAWHAGYDPGSMRRYDGSWLAFVRGMGDLDARGVKALASNADYFSDLETTPMTRSYKMLLVLGWIEHGTFPGSIPLDDLTTAVAGFASRSARVQADLGDAWSDRAKLNSLLEENPIAAWVGGKGTKAGPHFAIDGLRLETRLAGSNEVASEVREFTREVCEWRLAQYIARTPDSGVRPQHFVAKVSHAHGGSPMLFLPDRAKMSGLPFGATPVTIDDEPLEAEFVKIALNVVRRPGAPENLLPEILRRWFGQAAGEHGSAPNWVTFEAEGEGYRLRPAGASEDQAHLWRQLTREQIPSVWNLPFQGNLWRQGFLQRGKHMFLLVTLEKENMQEEHRYADRFLSPDRLQWQSQNRTAQDSRPGQDIAQHVQRGITVHLFVRRSSRTQRGGATPFTHCGELTFVRWEGDKPITVEWMLKSPIPKRLWTEFKVPGA